MNEFDQLYRLNDIHGHIMRIYGHKINAAGYVVGPTSAWIADQWYYVTDDEKGWSWESLDFNGV